MTDQLKKAIQQIKSLPPKKQEEIAKLIQDELSWDATFDYSQEALSSLAKEAVKEYMTSQLSLPK